MPFNCSQEKQKGEEIRTEENISRIAAGSAFTCGIIEEGSLWCWGSNEYGQLGCGDDRSEYNYPVKVRF
ncbi:MAG: hypothetical protein ACP5QK_01540 [Myxococcota bacterium]